MATQNLSDYDVNSIPPAGEMRFGIVVSEWNYQITSALLKGAVETLQKHGTEQENILIRHVPGSVELTLGAQMIAEYENVDAIIVLGCVIQGETRHFDFVCQSVTHGITELNMRYTKPIIFGVLTTNSLRQAQARAGGVHGNKGDEAAITAIKMAALQQEMSPVL